ncbi:MAG: two-component system cell cycle response regulator [Gammaproteobacteria bacterium]|jgi:two-component system cell cycle response regulator
MSNNITKIPDRRQEPTSRRQTTGETTAFDLSSIQAAQKREEQLEPMFLVCRGVQKGRPIPIHSGNWTIGRGALCDVSVQGRGISRTHLRLENSDEDGVVVIDAASTNGIFVNGNKVERCTLRDRDVLQLGPETVLRLMFAPGCDMDMRVRQYEQSIVDDLTGVHNRRFLNDSLDHEMAFAARHNNPLCVMLLDIDHFKAINDEFGHEAGDTILKQLAERIADALRNEDVFARLGGDEFAIVTRGLSLESSIEAAERLRTLVSGRSFAWREREVECTISLGGTMLVDGESLNASGVLKRADENLYAAKAQGRNRIAVC